MSDEGDRIAPGKGLLDGLAVTLKTMTRRSTTQQYPDVEPDLPPRSRGVIALLEENCTVCMLCARECPDWCIYIDSHKEEVVVPGAARARQRNVLEKFDIDYSLCMYCGICIEVCPFDALHWTPEFEYAETDVLSLLHDKDRLGEWMRTVPPPPAHDVLGEPSKEEATAARKAAGPGAATAAKTARPSAVRATTPTTAPRAVPPSRATGTAPQRSVQEPRSTEPDPENPNPEPGR
ncbi:NuoI/complex I 23 kDa subunit family protein [Actinoplanes rectilineatus]|uniref:NuoI/complex I 23 kDa subunit family protein n=1 Tax=Actinoplanes rectilineatus TaxID=113571 RepID=UPI000B1F3B91|nr:NADH-quinone oxidoreductase subunit I [Actinoplanes rectilineatus]